jgi:hypothetical protein
MIGASSSTRKPGLYCVHNTTSLSPSLRCCTHLYFLVIDYSFDEDSLDSFLEFSSSSNGGERPLNWVQFSFGTTFWGVFIRCYSKVRVHFVGTSWNRWLFSFCPTFWGMFIKCYCVNCEFITCELHEIQCSFISFWGTS